MSSIARRAGSALVRLLSRLADPAAVANETRLYAKAGIGAEVGELYALSGAGIINKMTGIRSVSPTDYVDGAALSWTTVAQVTIGAGLVRSSDDTFDIYLSGNQVVDITVAGANGLDAGAEAASTWYAVFLIGDSTGANPTAGLLSTSFTAPTMPAGYDKKRRIGCVRNSAGSDFLKFFQVWNTRTRRYWYDETRATLQVLTNGHATAFTTVTCTSRVPPSSQNAPFGIDFLAPTVGGNVADVLILHPTGANEATGPGEYRLGVLGTAGVLWDTEVALSAGQQVDYLVSDADDTANLYVLGFDDEI